MFLRSFFIVKAHFPRGLTNWIVMIIWIVLLSLFCKSTQDEKSQENGFLYCGPQNVTLQHSGRMLLLSWEDQPSCSAVQDVLIYQLVVLRTGQQVHYDEVSVTSDQIESTHYWNWTSSLALECASHSVRLRSQTSPWKEQTIPGKQTSEGPEVFPKDEWFKVGSTVTFCCILPSREAFSTMYLTGYDGAPVNTTSYQTYALTVYLNQVSENSCTNVICKTKTNKENGACVYIGYPPRYRDLQCETRDLESVECQWTVGGGKGWPFKKPKDPQLLGRPCPMTSEGRCSQKVEKVGVGERNWRLTAQNEFGKAELSDAADLSKRVHMFAPNGVKALTVNARSVILQWDWTVQQYNILNITCQVHMSCGEITIIENFGVGLNRTVLNDLIPNWTYNVTVRCGTAQYFWKWSDWSKKVLFQTDGDVPDALDVWMQMEGNQIKIIWKAKRHGLIKGYEVIWRKTTEKQQHHITNLAFNKQSFSLSLNSTKEYIVTVTARNIKGSSTPSTITIPSLNPAGHRVNTSRIIGSNGGFVLSWSASPAASCGYIVDWCPTSGPCTVDWLRVPPNKTNAKVFSKNFTDGQRFSFSVYACTQGAPLLLDKREGYFTEKSIKEGLFKSLKGKQQDSDFEVSWDPISLKEQTAFIQGYVLYCLDNSNTVIKFSTDDPDATRLRARNLKMGFYNFTMKAQTSVGECGAAFITATMNSPTENLIGAVLIPLVTVFGLLSLTTMLCFRHWTCIKQKVYPPIPKPVLTSVGEHGCHLLYMDQCHHSDVDIVDVLELVCSEETPINGSVRQENILFVVSQTPKGYYNQPQKKCPPDPLTATTTELPSLKGLPSSPFGSVFSNPSYNLIMKPGDQQSRSFPELQEGNSLDRSIDGYQPQGLTETFNINPTEEDPGSPMSCVFTYVVLPQSLSK
ncbi:leukemia inhibitory factor receptor-like isoform X2 [Trematomus bernacchii]|uniref:leukemia inhibitory factor receptor-like isoform X2 n=1 Tax=Trematomus bernacchii TaxID=40690 RepID=UPI00146E1500|nr:leukemia inhibitory factor receptor-like isoform X2 [Trematomus bernacchii]